ncbi:MAG: HlyD family efflux transporter periplasmic adaptor subunit [Cyclobacteriaceae bacterium]
MKKYLFYVVIVALMIGLMITSFLFKDGTEAMVAIVDSQVTAVSYQKPVIVKKLVVVAGQEVEKGDLLVEVVRPDLGLDLEKMTSEKTNLLAEIEANNRQELLELRILHLETQEKVGKVDAQIEELNYKLKQIASTRQNVKKLYDGKVGAMLEDTMIIQRKTQLTIDKGNILNTQTKQESLLISRYKEKNMIIQERLKLIAQEMASLNEELKGLSRYATFKGTIGTVNVQLDELVPPYKSLLTIYESKPTLIKAFMNERIKYQARVGDPVWVSSDKRNYKVQGTILEVGSRITDYPTRIEPFQTVKSYGQEVFVQIAPQNNFLNGEKVYVYPKELN